MFVTVGPLHPRLIFACEPRSIFLEKVYRGGGGAGIDSGKTIDILVNRLLNDVHRLPCLLH